jgi:FKBP-type peptidyl-prolyl cis-trans isomerase
VLKSFGAVMAAAGMVAVAACESPTGPSPRTQPTAPTLNVPFSTTDVVVGTGNTATTGKMVIVSYTGWLYDPSKPDHRGTQFDTGSSFGFVLGVGSVIAGWEQGIPGMKVGGTRILNIPPDLAYGQVANGIIPANSTLTFQVTLLAAQ